MAAGHFVLGDFTLFVVLGFVGAVGLDFLTTVVLLLQLVNEVCRRTFTVAFAYESCCCALLPIRGGSGERSPSFDLFL